MNWKVNCDDSGSSSKIGCWPRDGTTSKVGSWPEGHCPPLLRDGGVADRAGVIEVVDGRQPV